MFDDERGGGRARIDQKEGNSNPGKGLDLPLGHTLRRWSEPHGERDRNVIDVRRRNDPQPANFDPASDGERRAGYQCLFLPDDVRIVVRNQLRSAIDESKGEV